MKGQNARNFIKVLREYNQQVTRQRLAIYQALYDTDQHLDAEAIYRHVRSSCPKISLGTVYKTLEKFVGVGLAQQITPLIRAARYDAVLEPHPHAVCVDCQAVDNVLGRSSGAKYDPAGRRLVPHFAPSGFVPWLLSGVLLKSAAGQRSRIRRSNCRSVGRARDSGG